jgi:serine-type D-Ala-D-Ala carboxypeptidase (penicillin-binding protein 5/6)
VSHHSRFARTVGAVTLLIAVLLATSGGAGALVGPPPTPVPPHGSLSPFPSVLNTPSDQTTAPVLTAPVAILADLKSGQILFAKSPDTPRPIASLTKVMTALLTLERASPDDVVTISPDAVYAKKDYGYSSTLGLVAGERLSVRDLLYAMLLNSANDAAVALAIDVGGSYGDFVRMMNRKAHTLGMDHTAFYSPNGLDDRGHSTGPDMVRLIRAAMSDPGFGAIVATKVRAIPAPSGPPRVIQNRNVMLWLYPGATGAKTGYTAAARYCLIATATRHGRSLVAIVLGAPVDAFSDGAALLNYGFDSFERHEFVVDGDEVGAVRIRGGTVPAIAADGIGGLVPSAEIPDARRAIHIDPRAAFPPAPGQRIGTLKITLPGLTVGVSRLIAGSLPPPGPESGAPWWAEAAAAVGHAVAQTVHGLLRT